MFKDQNRPNAMTNTFLQQLQVRRHMSAMRNHERNTPRERGKTTSRADHTNSIWHRSYIVKSKSGQKVGVYYSNDWYSLITDALDSRQCRQRPLLRRAFLVGMDYPALVFEVLFFVRVETA